ncbi:MAG: peptidoglycan DD-metalloendopeptidase family protein [Terrimonas sp.]|nr:peptidoglycan DD-metalloendopeptidase family protein [Terrimonas sp.]
MTHSIQDLLKKNSDNFHPVVHFNPDLEKLLPLDFTDSNRDLTMEILSDTQQFTDYINDKLALAGAKFGIGGYAEHRTVYSRSPVFDAKYPGQEPRRLHLGTDIWGRHHTPVMAPLGGIVHSFAFNNNFGDYGATIILTHQLEGFVFHTLYGHLSLNDLKNIQEGQRIEKGEVFCEFGIPVDNGHWPPHLHFQVIIDLQGKEGDYPGVCAYAEKDAYLLNCPDPDLLLKMNRYIHP